MAEIHHKLISFVVGADERKLNKKLPIAPTPQHRWLGLWRLIDDPIGSRQR